MGNRSVQMFFGGLSNRKNSYYNIHFVYFIFFSSCLAFFLDVNAQRSHKDNQIFHFNIVNISLV